MVRTTVAFVKIMNTRFWFCLSNRDSRPRHTLTQPAFRDTFVDAANNQYQSHGLTFNVRPHTPDRLLVEETWQAYIEWLAEKGIYTADRVLDLGAHIGGFSLHAARHLGSTRIIAIEAAPQNYEMLERNIAINQLTDIVTPIWSAALDRDGVVPLSISPDHTGAHKVEHGLPTSEQVPRWILRVSSTSADPSPC